MGLLYMRDYCNFRVKEIEPGKRTLADCSDSSETTGKSLLTLVEATHSGIVNGNQRFYRPDRMQDSVYQWTQKDMPLKPVLVEHDKEGEAIGRVHKARYIDMSHQYRNEVPEVGDMLFYADAATKRLDLFKSVNLVLDKLQTINDYRGLGYIELGLKITSPDAIRKVLAGEYLTVSVGFQTDQAICSACHTDWATDDRCEHKLGELVDGKKMFLIAGNFFYKECSFVNFPADPFAQVISKELLQDSLQNKMFFMGLRPERRLTVLTACEMTDNLLAKIYESDIQVAEPEIKDSKMLVELQGFLDEMNKAPLTKERAVAITTAIKALEPKEDSEKELVRRVQTTLKSHVQKHNLEDTVKPEITKEQVEARIETLIPSLQDMSVDARKVYLARITEEAKQFELEVPSVDVESLQISQEAKTATDNVEPPKTLLDTLHTVEAFKFEDAKVPAEVISFVNVADGLYTAADTEVKPHIVNILAALLDHWNPKAPVVDAPKDSIVLSKEEHDTLMTGHERLETQIVALKSDSEALQLQNTSLVKSLKKDRATTLVAIKVLTGEAGFQGLSETQIQDKVKEREQRSLASLRDALGDELAKLSNFVFQGGSAATSPTEAGAKEVKDGVQLSTETTTVTDVKDSKTDPPARKLPKDPKAARGVLLFEARLKTSGVTSKE